MSSVQLILLSFEAMHKYLLFQASLLKPFGLLTDDTCSVVMIKVTARLIKGITIFPNVIQKVVTCFQNSRKSLQLFWLLL